MGEMNEKSLEVEISLLKAENKRLKESLRQFGRVQSLYDSSLEKLKKAQRDLFKSNNMLRAKHLAEQALISAEEEHAWLQQVCDIIVQFTSYPLVWVGYLDEDGKQVKLIAEAGGDEKPVDSGWRCLLSHHGKPGPAAEAMRTGKLMVIDDIRAEPDYNPWLQEAIRRGATSSAILPLTISGQPLGFICLYSESITDFDQSSISRLEDFAEDISFSIISLREKILRQEAELTLQKSRERFHLFFEHNSSAMLMIDPETGRITDANKTSVA